MSTHYRLRTLGDLLVEGPTGPVRALRRKERLLLVYVARRAPAELHRGELTALLWGDLVERRARHSLRQALFSIGRLLGDVLEVNGETVRAREERLTVDLALLETDVRGGRAAAALGGWTGEFLPGLEDAGAEPLREWIERERAGLRRLLIGAADAALAEARLHGGWDAVAAPALRLADAFPWEQEAQRILVEALTGSGRIEEAAARQAAVVERLRAELGAEPSEELRALGDRLRNLRCTAAEATLPSRPASPGPPGTGAAVPLPPGEGRVRAPWWKRPRWRTVAALAEMVLLLSAAGAFAAAFLDRHDVSFARAPDGRPPAARALYDQGLRAYYRDGRYEEARDLFGAALEQDSTFAMAAFYAARAAARVHGPMVELLGRAEALAVGAAEHERLVITAYAGNFFNDPRALAVAETLVARYPSDPDGALQLASALAASGRFLEAVTEYRRAVALDGAVPAGGAGACNVCEAHGGMTVAYWLADSLAAAIRTAGEWVALQPENPTPWQHLAMLLESDGSEAEAAAARRRLAALRPGHPSALLWEAQRALRRGRYAEADQVLAAAAGSVDEAVAREAVWWQVVSLRYQRRIEEARKAASRYREMHLPELRRRHPYATPLAIVLAEAGDGRSAAALFDTMFRALPDLGRPSRNARDRAWLLTLTGVALASAGDTLRLAALADSVQAIGALSGYGRDVRLHHHLRGLLLRARGDLEGSESHFRMAIYSSTGGFTRTNLELARVLLARGSRSEAVQILEAALRAPLDGPALYVTRPELEAALAQARQSAGRASEIVRAAQGQRGRRISATAREVP